MTEPAAPTSHKQTIATVSALVLGVAGALGWVKPPDTTAAAKSYNTTRAAVAAVEHKHDDDFDDLEERQELFERWVAKRLAEIDRDHIPGRKPSDADVESEPQWRPPPRPKRKRPPPAAKLPPSEDLFE